MLKIILSLLLLLPVPCWAYTVDNPYAAGGANQYVGDLHSHPFTKGCGDRASDTPADCLYPAGIDKTQSGAYFDLRSAALYNGANSSYIKSYETAGYDFSNISEHEYVTVDPVPPAGTPAQTYFKLMLIGEEVTMDVGSGSVGDIGIVGITTPGNVETNTVHPIYKAKSIKAVVDYGKSEGAFTVLNHPGSMFYSGEQMAYAMPDAVELPSSPYIPDQYLRALRMGAHINGVLSGDFHYRASDATINTSAGRVVVFAGSLTKENIMASLKSGNYYSTQGSRLASISISGRTVTLTAATGSTFSVACEVTAYTQTTATSICRTDEYTTSFTVPSNESFVVFDFKTKTGGTTFGKGWTNPIWIREDTAVSSGAQ